MATNQSPTDPDALLSLVQQIKENYHEPPLQPPKRGKKRDFSALSFLLFAAVAATLRTFGNAELHKLLEKGGRLRQAVGFERVPPARLGIPASSPDLRDLASEQRKPLTNVKDHLDCARWRIPSG
jgi:hypothetical protein